jgi:hypothetical protein
MGTEVIIEEAFMNVLCDLVYDGGRWTLITRNETLTHHSHEGIHLAVGKGNPYQKFPYACNFLIFSSFQFSATVTVGHATTLISYR